MDVNQVLGELVAIPPQRASVASVYLDARRTDEHQRETVRVFVRSEGRKALKACPTEDARAELQTTLDVIENYVSALLRQQVDELATGVAVFCCRPIGLLKVVAVRVPFEMAFVLNNQPFVTPLLRTGARVPPVQLALVDSSGARLYEVSLGQVDVEARIERPFPGFHHRGGWSQRNYQQHLGEIRDRNLREAATRFQKMAEAVPEALLVLAGQHIILSKLEEHLPERILSRVVARVPAPVGTTEGELRSALWSSIQPQLEAAVLGRERAVRDVALAEASRKNGGGVAGVADVLLALSEGRVHQLVVDSEFHANGSLCTSCGALAGGTRPHCPYCSATTRGVNLVEEVVRQAVRSDVEVVFLPRGEKLPPQTGLAAILRARGAAQQRRPVEEAAPTPAE